MELFAAVDSKFFVTTERFDLEPPMSVRQSGRQAGKIDIINTANYSGPH